MDPLTGMPNNSSRFGMFTNVAFIQSTDLMEYVNSLDDFSRDQILKHHGEFQSREEIERFLDHLQEDEK